MMNLEKILHNVKIEKAFNFRDLDVMGIALDSRKVQEGFIFVAQKGEETDGHKFIGKAIENGARAIVFEEDLDETVFDSDIIYIKVKKTTSALGTMASNFYNDPTKKLKLVGITGTNGKTTTVTLLFRLLQSMGIRCGLISTIENRINDTVIPTERTTPDVLTLHSLLAQMVEEKCEYAFMEVSSHAVVQQRIAGLSFAGAVFSNITLDHLDYHKTFSNYIKAKKKFFDDLPSKAFALSNIDDKNGKVMLQNTKAKKYYYSLSNASADFRAKVLDNSFDGLDIELNGKEIYSPLIGKFNAYNLLAIYSVAILLGLNKEEVLVNLSAMKSAPGRFDCYRLSTGAVAIVDYAHTPDALENVLKTINEINIRNKGKIFCVIGCGGDRDKSKRPIMASIGQKYANVLVITADNPRTEKIEDIIEDMKQGLKKDKPEKQHFCIPDRREAIKIACTLSQKNDIVLVAGKGHETYQEIENKKHHFDDKEEVLKY